MAVSYTTSGDVGENLGLLTGATKTRAKVT
jgi:hypothetical protein